MTTQNIKCTIETCGKCTYVSKKSAKENRKGIFDALLFANERLKEEGYPGSTRMLVGSAKRNLVYIKSENDTEYDHDIQVQYFSSKNKISNFTNSLREDFIDALKEHYENEEGNWNFENSTRVITITKTNEENGNLLASFDIALIDALENKIHVLDKGEVDNPIWNELENSSQAYVDAKNVDREALKQEYLNLKHNQKNMSKKDDNYKSSSKLFIEAVNNVK